MSSVSEVRLLPVEMTPIFLPIGGGRHETGGSGQISGHVLQFKLLQHILSHHLTGAGSDLGRGMQADLSQSSSCPRNTAGVL